MKDPTTRRLLALALMVSGLAFILTILGAIIAGSLSGSMVIRGGWISYYLVNARLMPWMVLAGAAYLAGLLLLIFSGNKQKKTDIEPDEEKNQE